MSQAWQALACATVSLLDFQDLTFSIVLNVHTTIARSLNINNAYKYGGEPSTDLTSDQHDATHRSGL